jgi:hypothetical protein
MYSGGGIMDLFTLWIMAGWLVLGIGTLRMVNEITKDSYSSGYVLEETIMNTVVVLFWPIFLLVSCIFGIE